MSAVYDGFISYSHEGDSELAAGLQSEVQRFAKPWWRRRALRLFRDNTALGANPHLWASVTDAMNGSEWFVLLASPEAAASPWVAREVDWWLDHKPRERVLLVVASGDLVWDSGLGRLDVERSTAVPPTLARAFEEEPRWVDARWTRTENELDPGDTRFREVLADVAAPLRGVPKDELESEELRQHRRTVRTAWGAAAILGLLAVVAITAGAIAAGQRSTARSQAARAEDAAANEQIQRLMAQSRLLQNRQTDVAILLALEAQQRDPSRATGQVLLESLSTVGPLESVRPVPPARNPGGVSLVTSGGLLWRATGDQLTPTNMATGEQAGEQLTPRPDHRVNQVEPLAGGLLAVAYEDGLIQVVDAEADTTLGERNLAEKPVLLRSTSNGAVLAVNPQDGGVRFLSVPNLDPIAQVSTPISGVWIAEGDGVVVGGGPVGTSLQHVDADGVRWSTEFGSPVRTLARQSAGDLMAAALVDGRVVAWSGERADSAKLIVDFDDQRFATALVFDDDGTLYVGRDDGAIYRLDPQRPNEAATPIATIAEEVRTLWVDEAGESLSAIGSDRWYRFRLDGLSPLAVRLRTGERGDVLASTDDRFVFGSEPGRIEVRSTKDGTLIRSAVVGESAAVSALAQLADSVVAAVVEFRGIDLSQLRALQDAAGVELQPGLTVPFIHEFQETSIVSLDDDGSERWRIPMDLPVIGLEPMGNGALIVALDVGGSVFVFDAVTGRELQMLARANPFFGAALTRAGDGLLAVGGELSVPLRLVDGTLVADDDDPLLGTAVSGTAADVVATEEAGVRVLDATDLETSRADIPTSAVVELAWLLDGGDYLVMRFQSGALVLLDLETQTRVLLASGTPLPIDLEPLSDGGFLMADNAGQVDRWTMDPADWRRIACELVGRDLSREEWATYFPLETYRPTCT